MRLKDLNKCKGISQVELAELIEVYIMQVSRFKQARDLETEDKKTVLTLIDA